MPQHEGIPSTARAGSVHSGNNSNDNGCYSAIYTFDNNLLRDMIKTHSSDGVSNRCPRIPKQLLTSIYPIDTGAQQADTLNKLLKQFGVELVSIGLPNYDPQSKQIESELTICSTDVMTLGTAMVKLSELGLPFKKRINNWYSGGRLPGVSNVVNNRQASDSRNWPMQESPPELINAMRGLRLDVPKKSTSSTMGRSFMNNDNDVFGGNRQRSYSETLSSTQTSSFREGNGSSSSRTRMEPTIQRTTLSQVSESDVKDRTPQPEQNAQSSQAISSRSLRIASHSLSLPTPSFVGRKEDISPTETTGSSGKLNNDEEWTKIDHPSRPSKNNADPTIPSRDVYRVPQRRLSDARDLPRLRIDTSNATLDIHKKHNPTETSTAPVSATFPEIDRLYGVTGSRSHTSMSPTNNLFAQGNSPAKESFKLWGPYTGGSEASRNYNIENSASTAASTATGEASQLNAAHQRARSYTYHSGIEPPRMDQPGPPSGASHTTINAGYHLFPAGPVSPVRQQPSYSYPPTRPEQSVQSYRFNQAVMEHNVRVQVPTRTMQENIHPRMQQQQAQNYGGYGGGYAGVPRTGYQTGSALRMPAVPVQPPPPPEVYMGAGSVDGFTSYILKPIPLTGPRFIR